MLGNIERFDEQIQREWDRMKQLVKSKLGSDWAPHKARHEFLRLNTVAATFIDDAKRIRFGPTPPCLGQPLVADPSPLFPEDWSLNQEMDGDIFLWFIPEQGATFTSEQLAHEVPLNLAKYYEKYKMSFDQ
jgi:hypothetical protein